MLENIFVPQAVGVLTPGALLERDEDIWVPLPKAPEAILGFQSYAACLYHLTCTDCQQAYTVDNGAQPDQYITAAPGEGGLLFAKCPACWPKWDLHRYRLILAPLCVWLRSPQCPPGYCQHDLTQTMHWLQTYVPSRAEEVLRALTVAGAACDCRVQNDIWAKLQSLLTDEDLWDFDEAWEAAVDGEPEA